MIKKLTRSITTPTYPDLILFYLLAIPLVSLSYMISGVKLLRTAGKTASFSDTITLFNNSFLYFFILFMMFLLIFSLISPLIKALNIKAVTLLFQTIVITTIPLIVIATLIDQQIYLVLGIHITSPILLDSLPLLKKEADIGIGVYLLIGSVILISTLIIAFIGYHLRKRMKRFPIIIFLLITGYLFFNARGIPSISQNLEPIWLYSWSKNNYVFDPIEVNYHPKSVKLNKQKDILIIVAESLRNDVFTPEIFPTTYRFSKKNNCLSSKRHYSNGHNTFNAIFSILYGVNSYNRIPFENEFDSKKAKNFSYPFKILRDNNYVIHGAFSSKITYSSLLIRDNFDHFEQPEVGSNIKNDLAAISWLKNQYEHRIQKKNNLYLIFLDSTHFTYHYPESFEKFKPVVDLEKDKELFQGLVEKKTITKLFNRYKNSAYFLDSLINKILTIFSNEIKKNNMIVLFVGDHGEEFGEFGQFGHVATRFHNPRIQVPFFICLPERPAQEVSLSSHVDIFPTIFDYLNIQHPEILTQFLDGISLLKPIPDDRYIVVSAHGFPQFEKSVAMISKAGKLWLKKISNSIDPINHYIIVKKTTLDDVSPPNQTNFIQLKKQLKRFQIRELNRFLKAF